MSVDIEDDDGELDSSPLEKKNRSSSFHDLLEEAAAAERSAKSPELLHNDPKIRNCALQASLSAIFFLFLTKLSSRPSIPIQDAHERYFISIAFQNCKICAVLRLLESSSILSSSRLRLLDLNFRSRRRIIPFQRDWLTFLLVVSRSV
jgi:hypothetical protein